MFSLNTLVFHKEGLVLDGIGSLDTFWVQLSPEAGFVRFASFAEATRAFRPVEVRPAHDPAPSPLVSLQGVLWSRQAASSAHQAIDLYQQAGDLIAQSSAQPSDPRELPAITHIAYQALEKQNHEHAMQFMKWLVVDVCGQAWIDGPDDYPVEDGSVK